MPVPWLDSLITERQCLVLIAGVSIDTTVLGGDSEVALNALGARGLVAGGIVKVSDALGLYAAQGLGAALAAHSGQVGHPLRLIPATRSG